MRLVLQSWQMHCAVQGKSWRTLRSRWCGRSRWTRTWSGWRAARCSVRPAPCWRGARSSSRRCCCPRPRRCSAAARRSRCPARPRWSAWPARPAPCPTPACPSSTRRPAPCPAATCPGSLPPSSAHLHLDSRASPAGAASATECARPARSPSRRTCSAARRASNSRFVLWVTLFTYANCFRWNFSNSK